MLIGVLTNVYPEVNGEKIPSEVRIPSEVNGITITSIEFTGEGTDPYSVFPTAINWEEAQETFDSWDGIGEPPDIKTFYNGYDTKITTIIVPSTVTRIGYQAVAYLQWLENISIPNSVTEIGDLSFAQCQFLKNIVLSENLKKIGIQAFLGCKSLNNIYFPDSLETIDFYAFQSCTSLETIYNLKYSIEIGGLVFEGTKLIDNLMNENNGVAIINNKLLKVDENKSGEFAIPNDVTQIAQYAFSECDEITKINMSNNVIKIDAVAFSGCNKLTEVNLSNNITKIEDRNIYMVYSSSNNYNTRTE